MNGKRSKRRLRVTPASEAGFTLHELLVASFVFIVGMSAVIVMQATLIKSNAVAGDISVASNIASSALEQLRISEFSRVRNTGNCPPSDPTFDIDCYYDRRGQALGSNASQRFFVLF